MILDTNFLVYLERESRRGENGPASQFLEASTAQAFCITPTIAGELACGASLASRAAWESLILPFQILPINSEVSWQYGEIYRHLRDAGQLIGTNDLWIAAAGLANALPVVTRNTDEFRRVPNLQVVGF